jgi:hypothetical protein
MGTAVGDEELKFAAASAAGRRFEHSGATPLPANPHLML